MTQAQTLQDIYSKIADIYDKFCEGLTSTDSDPITMITEQLVINENAWTSNGIKLSNPDADQAIGSAQLEINSVLSIALTLAKDEATSYDASILNPQNVIVPIPKGSPIMLLPKLIKLLVLYKAPLKFLLNALLDYIKEAILEHIKRKLLEKKGEVYGLISIANSQLVKIPKDVIAIAVSFDNLPAWVSKRFEAENLNKSIVIPAPSPLPDMSKFLLRALGTCQIGFALTGAGTGATVFWDIDTKLEYSRQIINLPDYQFTNYQRYAYLHLEFANTCQIGFLKLV